MQCKKEAIYTLVLSNSEAYNMVNVFIEYLDAFEEESHEMDTFSVNNMYELLYMIGDDGLINKIQAKIEIIEKRNEER